MGSDVIPAYNIKPGLCQCGCGQKTSICTWTNSRLGYYKGKPTKYIKGHNHKNRQDQFGPDNPNWKGGLSSAKLYHTWKHIISRCTKKNDPEYKNYGGRGILICNEWMDFNKFYDWAIKNGWDKAKEIDRRNNNLGYFPLNCRFVTRTTNAQNTRVSRYWVVNGTKYNSMREAATMNNVSPRTISRWCGRIKIKGRVSGKLPGCHSYKKYR